MSTTTSIEITSLHPFYVYEWSVSAFTVGEGPYSSIVTLTTPEDGKLIVVSVKKNIEVQTIFFHS